MGCRVDSLAAAGPGLGCWSSVQKLDAPQCDVETPCLLDKKNKVVHCVDSVTSLPDRIPASWQCVRRPDNFESFGEEFHGGVAF